MADGSVACMSVGSLPTGVNTLTYTVTVTATDDDTQTNALQFQVVDGTPAAASTAACRGLSLAAPVTDTGSDSGGMMRGPGRTTALVVLAAAAVVVVGACAVVVRLRNGARPTGRRRATW